MSTAPHPELVLNSLVTVLKGHDDWVQITAVSNTGGRVLFGSQDSTLRFWDLTARLQTEEFVQSSAICTGVIPADEIKVAIDPENRAFKVQDSWTGETHFEDTEAHADIVYSIEFSPDHKRLALEQRVRALSERL